MPIGINMKTDIYTDAICGKAESLQPVYFRHFCMLHRSEWPEIMASREIT